MADNFLERQYDDYLKSKEKKQKAASLLWKKRLAAYEKSLKSAAHKAVDKGDEELH